MWIYKVINSFRDLQDDNHLYSVGDIYPRKGSTSNKDRTNELKSEKNKTGRPLIKAERKKKEDKK